MARKSWDELSPAYRARLERAGIGSREHAAGASLHKARGHKTMQHEKTQRIQNRVARDTFAQRWAGQYARLYGRPVDEVRRELARIPVTRLNKGLRRQVEMQRLYDQGLFDEATEMWEQRDTSLPEWMFFYHGYFN